MQRKMAKRGRASLTMIMVTMWIKIQKIIVTKEEEIVKNSQTDGNND